MMAGDSKHDHDSDPKSHPQDSILAGFGRAIVPQLRRILLKTDVLKIFRPSRIGAFDVVASRARPATPAPPWIPHTARVLTHAARHEGFKSILSHSWRPVLANTTTGFVMFQCYTLAIDLQQRLHPPYHHHHHHHQELSSKHHALAGLFAGIGQSVLSCPISLMRYEMAHPPPQPHTSTAAAEQAAAASHQHRQTHHHHHHDHHPHSVRQPMTFTSALQAVRQRHQSFWPRRLYPFLLARDACGATTLFGSYIWLKERIDFEQNDSNSNSGTGPYRWLAISLAGGLAGSACSLVEHPWNPVIHRAVQQSDRSVWHVAREIFRTKGLRGFTRGAMWSAINVFSPSAIGLLLFEYAKQHALDQDKQ